MKRFVYPVIHYADDLLAIEQAALAFECGADGVFLISHGGEDERLYAPAMTIKGRFPGKQVGLNLLGARAREALDIVMDLGLDMIWTDIPGVTSRQTSLEAHEIAAVLKDPRAPLFFGSVAFKYQPYEPDPAGAAAMAVKLGMLPTTSGPATGVAPEPAMLQAMRASVEAAGGNALAVASGMTCENVSDFLSSVTHYLVATKVSLNAHEFDRERLMRFVTLVHGGSSNA